MAVVLQLQSGTTKIIIAITTAVNRSAPFGTSLTTSAPADFVNNEIKKYHTDFIGVSEYNSKGRINYKSYDYDKIHSKCGPSVIDLYYDKKNWEEIGSASSKSHIPRRICTNRKSESSEVDHGLAQASSGSQAIKKCV